MANDISGMVWNLDTPSATDIYKHRVKIGFIEWFNPTTIGDLMQLVDIQGKIIVDGRAEVANQTQIFKLERWYNGLRMPTLVSGKVYVHLGSGWG